MSEHKNLYKYPVGRKIANGRIPAEGRKPASGRILIGWPDDSKVRVVLDTNIIIYALEGFKKGASANDVEKSCCEIITQWYDGKFNIGLNCYLYAEYKSTCLKLLKAGKIQHTQLNRLLRAVDEKAIKNFRLLVNKQHIARRHNDDHLFDGLSGNYLVSEDKNDVVCDMVINRQSSFAKVVTSTEFLKSLTVD